MQRTISFSLQSSRPIKQTKFFTRSCGRRKLIIFFQKKLIKCYRIKYNFNSVTFVYLSAKTKLFLRQVCLRHFQNGVDLHCIDIYSFLFVGVYRPLILHTECYFSEIYKSPLGGDDLFTIANTLPLEHASCPSAVASNPAEEKVYWTDLTLKHIARANLDGTEEEIIVQNVSYSLGLVVDSYGGNMYFTDKVKKTVEVAKLDGSNRKVLIRSYTHQPVGLAIDSSRGYVSLLNVFKTETYKVSMNQISN